MKHTKPNQRPGPLRQDTCSGNITRYQSVTSNMQRLAEISVAPHILDRLADLAQLKCTDQRRLHFHQDSSPARYSIGAAAAAQPRGANPATCEWIRPYIKEIADGVPRPRRY